MLFLVVLNLLPLRSMKSSESSGLGGCIHENGNDIRGVMQAMANHLEPQVRRLHPQRSDSDDCETTRRKVLIGGRV